MAKTEFPELYLRIQVGTSEFCTFFGSIKDLLSDNVWKAATDNLHEMLKEKLDAEKSE